MPATIAAMLLAACGQTAFEEDVIFWVNVARAEAGVQPVEYDARLSAAESLWLKINDGCTCHGLPVEECRGRVIPDIDGDGWCWPNDRAIYYGWKPWQPVSENGLKARAIDAMGAVNLWMSSEGHRNNLLSPYWNSAGVARNAGRVFMGFGQEEE